MKKPIIIFGSVIVFLSLTYFSMWFFISQTFAIKISHFLEPVYPVLESTSIEDFRKGMQSSRERFDMEIKREDDTPFAVSLRSIYTKYDNKINDEFSGNDIDLQLLKLGFLGEMINVGLGRALYEDKSVPLGAMKTPLLQFVKYYDTIAMLIEGELDPTVSDRIIRNYRTCQFILNGKVNVLKEYLNSDNKVRIMTALDEIEKNKIKKLQAEVESLFTATQDSEIKFECVRTAFSLPKYKNSEMDNYIISLFSGTDIPVALIELVGQTYNVKYMPYLTELTNQNMKADIRDAALTAISRMQVK